MRIHNQSQQQHQHINDFKCKFCRLDVLVPVVQVFPFWSSHRLPNLNRGVRLRGAGRGIRSRGRTTNRLQLGSRNMRWGIFKLFPCHRIHAAHHCHRRDMLHGLRPLPAVLIRTHVVVKCFFCHRIEKLMPIPDDLHTRRAQCQHNP